MSTLSDTETKEELLYRDIDVMGMPLRQYKWKSCIAEISEGNDWATIYSIASQEQGKGHATELLTKLKEIYKNKKFGGTVALNDTMSHLYKKLGIKEYN